MENLIQRDNQEKLERQKPVCSGCGKPKDIGCIVCWDCFKRGKHPYKYWEGSWAEWLDAVKGGGSCECGF